MKTVSEIRVWDPLVRGFHWTLVLAYLVAWLTEDDVQWLHVYAGYLILGLLAVRLVWGVVGTRYARFSQFVAAPAEVKAQLKDLARLKAKRYIGHNPAGGWMILAMIVTLSLTCLTGLAVYGVEEHAGPLASLMAGAGEGTEDFLEETHEFFANFSLFLVMIHIAGVLIESLLQKENLVRAMITGYKAK